MESELAFIKLQLWVVIGLLLLFFIANILCRIFGCGKSKVERWGEMHDKGDIDRLLEETESRLRSHPHDTGALYYGARAMMAKGRYKDARSKFERLSLIDPSLREICQEEIAEIDRVTSGS